MSSLGQEVAPQVPAGDDQFAPEPGFVEANLGQFGDFVTRVQTGLAANDTEKGNFLKKKFGAENVTEKDGTLYFRKGSKEKFRRLDPATLELVNDILPDFARELITEGAMLPGELGGAAMGAPAGPAGVAGGALMGRVASVPMANAVADSVAQWAGIPQDEARDRYKENAIGMAAETVLPVVGKQLLKRIPGTTAGQLAYKASKEAGDKELVALSKQSQEVANAVEMLNAQGRAAKIDGSAIGVPGANVSLMGHQLSPDNPVLRQYTNAAASDPRFINAQQQLAEDWGASLDSTLKEIGRRGNPTVSDPNLLAKNVTNAVADLEKAEGAAIGAFRNKAMAQLKNNRLPLNKATMEKADELLREFGFTPKIVETQVARRPGKLSVGPAASQGLMRSSQLQQKWNAPKDLRPLIGKMGLTDAGQVRAVVNNLEQLSQAMDKGATLSDMDRLRTSFGALTDPLFRTKAGAKIGALTGDLRQTYRETVQAGLDSDFDRAAFNSAMDEFSQLRTNVGTLKNALNEDASAKAIVKGIFTGKENLAKVQAIKKISPESFGALREEFVNQMLVDYGNRSSATGFNSERFMKAVNSQYGEQFMKEVFGGSDDLVRVKNLLSVTERIEKTFKGASVDTMSEQQKRGIMDSFIGVVTGMKFKTLNGVSAIMRGTTSREHIINQIMTRDGIDQYVANYPGKVDKKELYGKLNQVLAENKFYEMARKAGEPMQRPLKAGMKQEAQEQAPRR
jgi:hypothetical protein